MGFSQDTCPGRSDWRGPVLPHAESIGGALPICPPHRKTETREGFHCLGLGLEGTHDSQLAISSHVGGNGRDLAKIQRNSTLCTLSSPYNQQTSLSLYSTASQEKDSIQPQINLTSQVSCVSLFVRSTHGPVSSKFRD